MSPEPIELSDDDPIRDVLISALEHYSYCPRQCALIHVEQSYDDNLYTMRGNLMHTRVDSGEDTPNRGIPTQRGMPLWSERYGLRGKSDVVEWHNHVPYPVEYKVGRRRGVHANIQLCAQAFCLEEMLDCQVPRGAIYYGATRRRHEVAFDSSLRMLTIETINALRQVMIHQQLPTAPNDERCTHCSLLHACLPAVISQPNRLRAWNKALFTPIT